MEYRCDSACNERHHDQEQQLIESDLIHQLVDRYRRSAPRAGDRVKCHEGKEGLRRVHPAHPHEEIMRAARAGH
ncbi:hypothetical protein ES703_72880 [subsurface metagenome]